MKLAILALVTAAILAVPTVKFTDLPVWSVLTVCPICAFALWIIIFQIVKAPDLSQSSKTSEDPKKNESKKAD